ncbi:LysR substrate-binding domain-containing protein, partial [Acinetobacter baumannii]
MGKLAAAFALKYPEVRLEVTTEDRSVDMIEEGYDLVIRVNPDPDETLVGRVLMRDRLVVVANPTLPR